MPNTKLTTTEKVSQLWRWAFGNGIQGADEKIRDIEKLVTGERKCSAYVKIKEHENWHKQNKIFLWSILIPVYINTIIMIMSVLNTLRN